VEEVSKVTDDRLIEATINGDNNAYRELVIRYQQLVFATIFRIVGDYQDAEDLAQEVFVKAYESLASFRGDAKFSTWLIKISTNKALDYRRRRHKQATCVVGDDIFDIDIANIERSSAVHESQPELACIERESMTELQEYLESLPEVYRQVLYQSYIDELSCSEIAEKEGISVKTIASRIYRGKKLLRSQQTRQTGEGRKS
jgi:RNA polymerase sigma-70 factor (ECF subfamily)